MKKQENYEQNKHIGVKSKDYVILSRNWWTLSATPDYNDNNHSLVIK